MRNNPANFGLLILCAFFFSCESPPEFPNEPSIGFDKIEFFEVTGNRQDSLKISIYFRDGDGDLGISSEESKTPPFHEGVYYSYNHPTVPIYNIENVSSDTLLSLGDSDTLPPFDCINYREILRTIEVNGEKVDIKDTVYVQYNPKNRNFLVDFFIKKNDEFEEYDFLLETCIPSDGRFPHLNSADHSRPLEGVLTYSFRALNLRKYFDDHTLKLRIQILDRGENKSNIVETPEFTLDQIKVN